MAEKEQKGTNLAHLLAKSYTIEDKLKDDDRNSRRERYGGPTSTFTEKTGYVPNVQVNFISFTNTSSVLTLGLGPSNVSEKQTFLIFKKCLPN
jgi:hypothetical protein